MTPEQLAPASGAVPTTKLAGLLRRLAALVYDGFLLVALLLVAGFALLPLINPVATGTAHAAEQLYLLSPASRAFVLFFYIAVTGLYCIGFWSNGRRTLAMKTWGLALARPAGGRLDIRLATLRFAAAWIGPATALAGYALAGRWGLALGFLNYGWALLDPNRQFLHDRLAGTRIVRE